MPISVYILPMARAPTTLDPFNAIAEPKRREVLAALAGRPRWRGGADGREQPEKWAADRVPRGSAGLVGARTGAGEAREWPVAELVAELGWPQPQVSKHLAVLRSVGLVIVRRQGRQRMYRLNAKQLKAVHDWTGTFERFWTAQLDRIKTRAEELAREREPGYAESDRHTE